MTISGLGRARGYLRSERKTCNRKDKEAATATARRQEKVKKKKKRQSPGAAVVS